VLELRFGPRAKSGEGRILVLGHLDTVWPLGKLKEMPCRTAPDSAGKTRIWGPGTLDMKVGVAMAFTALEMLDEAKMLGREIVLLLNSEEEVGSPVSRPITEKLAGECSAVYVLEPAQGLAYKTSRKGTGNWRLAVEGLAAHAGVDFTRGRSAVLELVRLIEQVSDWTDLDRGTTVNVGVIAGGTKSNVIPAEAWAEVDVRVARRADGLRMERRFAALKSTPKSGCSLTVEGGVNRPPMERTRETVKLFRQAQALAAELDWELIEAGTGGASDGNFTSALGIATLVGMGAVGDGAHAVHESVLLEHIAPRTALLAGMLVG
jgi:glutamate carboxypeptidase